MTPFSVERSVSLSIFPKRAGSYISKILSERLFCLRKLASLHIIVLPLLASTDPASANIILVLATSLIHQAINIVKIVTFKEDRK